MLPLICMLQSVLPAKLLISRPLSHRTKMFLRTNSTALFSIGESGATNGTALCKRRQITPLSSHDMPMTFPDTSWIKTRSSAHEAPAIVCPKWCATPVLATQSELSRAPARIARAALGYATTAFGTGSADIRCIVTSHCYPLDVCSPENIPVEGLTKTGGEFNGTGGIV